MKRKKVIRLTKFVDRLQLAGGRWLIANYPVILLLIKVIVWDMER
jgi:hypothetical protein